MENICQVLKKTGSPADSRVSIQSDGYPDITRSTLASLILLSYQEQIVNDNLGILSQIMNFIKVLVR